MLPPFIIEQIRKREEEERQKHDQPQLDLPLEDLRQPEQKDEEVDRGVVIVDLG